MNDTTSWNELLRRSDWEGREQRYPEALKLAQEALEWVKREFGEESYEVAATWEYVAKAASFNADKITVKAAQAAVSGLMDKLSKSNIDQASPRYASALVYIGNLMFMRAGDYLTAQESFAKALQIMEKTQGPGHAAVGYILARIGQLYDLCGEPQKALPYLERAQAIFKTALGPRHVDFADLLEDLGNSYQHAARSLLPSDAPNPVNDPSQYSKECYSFYEKALDALSRARKIREQIGNSEEYLYSLLSSEAETLGELGRAKESAVLQERAKKTLPPA
jgi:tetratricopeptide (TPR) repeat protein